MVGDVAPGHPAYGLLRPVTVYASVLLAGNPSPMTSEGTNTWLLRAAGSPHCVVVDPGPDDEEHLRRVAVHGPVSQVLLTHRHPDHAGGAHRLPSWSALRCRPPIRTTGRVAAGSRRVTWWPPAGLEVRVLATPGHTSDSLCFLVESEGAASVLTGDTVLGRGSTVIAHPDGRLRDYLTSLRRLAELPPEVTVLPGHGPTYPMRERRPEGIWRTASSGWSRFARRVMRSGRNKTASRTLGRSSRSSTPTWTRCCGRPRTPR